MRQSSNSHKNVIESPVVPYFIIAACLALSFVDMLMLSKAVEVLFGFNPAFASTLALFLALVGSASAFLWGRSEASDEGTRFYKSHSFWIWFAIGVLFVALRATLAIVDPDGNAQEGLVVHIANESLMAITLAILYIGTGLVIRSETRKVFDTDRFAEYKEYKAAKNLQNSIAKKYAEAERIVLELESFKKYYSSLNNQYLIRRQSLEDAERSTLSTVVKQVLEDNPQLSPQVVDDIQQSLITERKNRIL